jgi:predicted transcriptional regulator
MLTDIHEIKKLRRSVGLTQKELAQRAGVSQSLIAKIESGELDPAFTKAMKIFDALSAVHAKKRAHDIMNRSIISASPGDRLRRAIELMKRHSISQMPVIDDRKVVGMVSESTILDAFIQERGRDTLVREIMADAPPIITKEASIDTVTQLLREYPIILVSEGGKLLGHITKADVLMKGYR